MSQLKNAAEMKMICLLEFPLIWVAAYTKNSLLSTCSGKQTYCTFFQEKLSQGGLEGDRERVILLY